MAEEYKFLHTIRRITQQPMVRTDRTRVGTKSIFGVDLRFSLQGQQFPLLTTRKMALRPIFEELMWILRGQTDVSILEQKGVNVWTPNSTRAFLDARRLHHYATGDIGPGYGFQMRHFGATYVNCTTDYTSRGVDQLQHAVQALSHDPTSRRIMINLWNVADLTKMALPPCGFGYQFYTDGTWLSCKVYQRSSDILLAGGWNIASASLFVYLMASVTRLHPKELIWSVGDCHVYQNQLEVAEKQLDRIAFAPPKLVIRNQRRRITDFEFADVELQMYRHHSKLTIPMNA